MCHVGGEAAAASDPEIPSLAATAYTAMTSQRFFQLPLPATAMMSLAWPKQQQHRNGHLRRHCRLLKQHHHLLRLELLSSRDMNLCISITIFTTTNSPSI
jgi:hypothetical protein